MRYDKMLTLTLAQIRFCAEEVEKQQDGPLAVYDMCNAFGYVLSLHGAVLAPYGICGIAQIVVPSNKGFRQIPVTFDNRLGGVAPENIERQLEFLCKADITPEEFYQRFEEIHPFEDGNGRVGAILYNFHRGLMDAPVAPPMFE